MLAIFRTNQFAVNILLILYVLLIRSSIFIVADENWAPTDAGVLAELFYAGVGSTGLYANLLACLLIFLQALMVNMIVGQNRLANKITLFPGLFYILVASSLPEFLHLSPALIANTFYIIAVRELLSIYNKSSSTGNLFNAGLWIGVASLCYMSYLSFVFLGIIAINILIAFRLKAILTFLSGIFVPFFLSAVYFFLIDQLPDFWNSIHLLSFSSEKYAAPNNWETYAKLGFFFFLLLVTIFSYGSYTSKKDLRAQKQISILFWALVFSGLSILTPVTLPIEHLLLTALPLGIFLALSFLSLKPMQAEMFHMLLLIGILFMHLKPYWDF